MTDTWDSTSAPRSTHGFGVYKNDIRVEPVYDKPVSTPSVAGGRAQSVCRNAMSARLSAGERRRPYSCPLTARFSTR